MYVNDGLIFSVHSILQKLWKSLVLKPFKA